ncbi:MAG: LamG domain-containing protein, partial [Thermoguttaceae bacterium]|nr:LamG domain-containing protein [Thermoguttaceae bacterium]
ADLSSSQDTVIYMYYGGPAVGHLINNPQDTWDTNFRIVQHMEESAGATTFTDSTSRNRNMSPGPTGATAGQTGIFYRAVGLGGYANQQYLRATGDSVPATSSLTIEGWAKIIDDDSNQNQYPFSIGNRAAIRTMIGGSPRFGFIWRYSDGTFGGWDTSPALNIADDKWHYMVQVYDASAQKMYLYLDGQLLSPAMDVTKTLASDNDYYVGAWVATYGWVPGTYDEFRISDVARSAAWIRANWLLLSDPQTYLLFGALQHVPEPATGSLALLALAALAAVVWRKQHRSAG